MKKSLKAFLAVGLLSVSALSLCVSCDDKKKDKPKDPPVTEPSKPSPEEDSGDDEGI